MSEVIESEAAASEDGEGIDVVRKIMTGSGRKSSQGQDGVEGEGVLRHEVVGRKDSEESTGSEMRRNLPVRLASDLPKEMSSWYFETFSNELSEVSRSMKIASDKVKAVGTGAHDDESSTVASDAEDVASSVSGSISTKLEIALMQAKEEVETQAKEKDMLQNRLKCLEDIEELRQKLLEYRETTTSYINPDSVTLGAAHPRWDRDEDNPLCYRCKSEFSFRNRRHHCRKCAHIFCENCAPKTNVAPLPQFGYTVPVRHCIDCLSARTKKYRAADYTSRIDEIRKREKQCLKTPTSENLIETLHAYVQAIETISNAENFFNKDFRRRSHATLLRCMHGFLQLPEPQECLDESPGTGEGAKKVIASVLACSKEP
mmetsp:Transcript_35963/g.57509  ORF Transcript_35963/g.57509 Transcript_35963/m.57509 type:complete len:373 (+) Transcript_35963:67-1185(+)